eukprot:2538793-Alexandrium_andersonii.AAC.1
MSDGVWTSTALAKIRECEDGLCPWCGLEPETVAHLWWECERFADLRASVLGQMADEGHDGLPPAIANCGLVPEPVLAE